MVDRIKARSKKQVAISYESERSRTVFVVGHLEEDLSTHVIERLFTLSEQDTKRPIYMVINTYGGEVDEMFAIYDAMKYIAAPVRTIGLGKIMSAGVLLLAAGEAGYRKIGKNARVMYHLGYEENFGNVFEQKANLDEFERQEQQCDECIAVETGQSLKTIQDLHAEKVDYYMTPEEAVELNLVDDIIE